MKVNWNRGVGRVGVALSALYLVFSLLVIAIIGRSAGAVYEQQFTVSRDSRTYDVKAFTQPDAERQVAVYLVDHPIKPPAPKTGLDLLNTLAATAAPENPFDKFDPIIVGNPFTPLKSYMDWGRSALAALQAVIGLAIGYTVFWTIFQGVWWTIRGFSSDSRQIASRAD